MKNAEMPAMPTSFEIADLGFVGVGNVADAIKFNSGLTKREMFAMHAMQAMLTSEFAVNFNGDSLPDENDTLCKRAVHYADELLKELEK